MTFPHSSSRLLFVAGLLLGALPALAQDAGRVTPMTPDIVESYDQVLPSADFIRREAMVPMRETLKVFSTSR